MSTRSQLTKDLNESVKSLLGKNIKILLKCLVKLEKSDKKTENRVLLEKSDKKTENRVLVFSPCRLFFLTAKVPTRIDFHFHYLEIQAIESKKPNQLSFSVTGLEKALVVSPHQQPPSPADGEAASHEVDGMLHTLASALRVIFPAAMLTHVVRRVELVPETRLARLLAATPPLPPSLSAAASGGVGPCGGFSTQYAAMCDFHGLPYREEVAWGPGSDCECPGAQFLVHVTAGWTRETAW
ncbi:hypothetical protein B566_EDAN014292 [Ephemera danica]|nr:hypothetical protein B566_EDAN014292 [Ephemera danica]